MHLNMFLSLLFIFPQYYVKNDTIKTGMSWTERFFEYTTSDSKEDSLGVEYDFAYNKKSW